MSGTPPATASPDGATPFFTMVNSRLPAPHRAPRLDPAGWEQRLTSVPGRDALAAAITLVTGALMFKSEHDMRQDGSWDESRQTVTTTICPYCGVGCNLELHVQDNRIVKVTSPLDHDVGRGHLCVKGRFGFEFVQRRAGES